MVVFLFYAAYLTAALLCLRQWGGPEPWARIDLFSGGFFVVAPLWLAENLVFARSVGSSREVRAEALGMTYDPGMFRWVLVLSLAELLVFFDYGHWRLVPELASPGLQGAGLALWTATPFWLLWADRHLGRLFSKPEAEWRLLTDGPFRIVRHPRYTGLLASRVAFSLLFASPLAWLFALGWAAVVLRRVALEQRHLRERFGGEYEKYVARTAGLIPYVF